MHYKIGSFGILNIDDMNNPPLLLLDGGIEKRFNENYEFFNNKRPEYKGYLFQYTLQGRGVFEKNGYCNDINEEEGFIVKFPEESKYYLNKNDNISWMFIYILMDLQQRHLWKN